jgi:hypothetical protein
MVEAWRLEEIKHEENKVNNNPQRPRLWESSDFRYKTLRKQHLGLRMISV